MLSLLWAFAFLCLAYGLPIASSDTSSTNDSSKNSVINVGTSKTFPLKASIPSTVKRSLKIHRSEMILVDDVITGKQALEKLNSVAVSPSQGTALVDQDGHDISYYIEVTVGSANDTSSKKPFNLIVDTGSFYTWVYSINCTSSVCTSHKQLDPVDSNSLEITNNDFTIAYTSGSVDGIVVQDTLSYAGFSSPQHFGLAAKVDSSLADFPVDGIMGLPANDKSPDFFPGVINTLYNQKLIKDRIFSINLGRANNDKDEGSFTIGGVDASKYTGNITYVDILSQKMGFWEINVDGTYVNGYKIDFGSRTAIIDTGTTLLIMAPEDALKLHGFISGSQTDGSNFVIPCNTTMDLEFQLGGKKWAVSSQDYIGGVYSEADKLCISNIQGIQFDNNNWILGDVFLKNVYSVYNMETQQVGFASKSESLTEVTPDKTFVYSAGSKNDVSGASSISSASVTIASASATGSSLSAAATTASASSSKANSASSISFCLSLLFSSMLFVLLFI
ncbi:hypothetical protein D0Z00_001978 [Geotrichum galactomycetum]|uniref:Uncharacterized protein n=1 Tax=Geotrichum galactomycetum TaxID=27317 RepID=A0ACB6V5G8_9ASCO|nr:hypothetical protein D0Z00_001978 [Geotrichum candidum]